jgi:N-dimethylarginine dimethylaminohydrolase
MAVNQEFTMIREQQLYSNCSGSSERARNERDRARLRADRLRPRARGFEIAEVDMSEISKTGGGIHCMAQSLRRAPKG